MEPTLTLPELPLQPREFRVRPRPEFDTLARDRQLDALDIAIRAQSHTYGVAMVEAFTESDDAEAFALAVFDKTVNDAALGALVRRLQINYAAQVARHRDDDLTEFL